MQETWPVLNQLTIHAVKLQVRLEARQLKEETREEETA
jgi:hypothetical protein